VTIVRLDPDFASVYEGELKELAGILDLTVSIEPARLVLDLSGTQYFGSAFIGFLIAVSSRMNARPGGRFAIGGASGFARVALASTKSDQLIEVFDSVNEAVAAYQ
jgi:anti-sigma B factor antagonist